MDPLRCQRCINLDEYKEVPMSTAEDIVLKLFALLSLIPTKPQRMATMTLLPQTRLEQLSPQFRRARNFLGDLGHDCLSDWLQRVRAVPNGRTMILSAIAPSTWTQVSQVLLERRPFDVAYRSHRKYEVSQFRLHPAGLVSRHSINYLLASVDGYDNVRHFALHRMQDIAVVDYPLPLRGQFDVDEYIATGISSHRQAGKQLEMIADVSVQIAMLLGDTLLSLRHSLEDVLGQAWKALRLGAPGSRHALVDIRPQQHSYTCAPDAGRGHRAAPAQLAGALPIARPRRPTIHSSGHRYPGNQP
jgi:hypothetical protein